MSVVVKIPTQLRSAAEGESGRFTVLPDGGGAGEISYRPPPAQLILT